MENASNDAQIASGKVNFVVDAPEKIVLGDVSVNKLGQAGVSTQQAHPRSRITSVEAEYTPSKSKAFPRAWRLPSASR